MNWHVIVNPKAGGGKAKKIWNKIQQEGQINGKS